VLPALNCLASVLESGEPLGASLLGLAEGRPDRLRGLLRQVVTPAGALMVARWLQEAYRASGTALPGVDQRVQSRPPRPTEIILVSPTAPPLSDWLQQHATELDLRTLARNCHEEGIAPWYVILLRRDRYHKMPAQSLLVMAPHGRFASAAQLALNLVDCGWRPTTETGKDKPASTAGAPAVARVIPKDPAPAVVDAVTEAGGAMRAWLRCVKELDDFASRPEAELALEVLRMRIAHRMTPVRDLQREGIKVNGLPFQGSVTTFRSPNADLHTLPINLASDMEKRKSTNSTMEELETIVIKTSKAYRKVIDKQTRRSEKRRPLKKSRTGDVSNKLKQRLPPELASSPPMPASARSWLASQWSRQQPKASETALPSGEGGASSGSPVGEGCQESAPKGSPACRQQLHAVGPWRRPVAGAPRKKAEFATEREIAYMGEVLNELFKTGLLTDKGAQRSWTDVQDFVWAHGWANQSAVVDSEQQLLHPLLRLLFHRGGFAGRSSPPPKGKRRPKSADRAVLGEMLKTQALPDWLAIAYPNLQPPALDRGPDDPQSLGPSAPKSPS
jgi:hypothetical protein